MWHVTSKEKKENQFFSKMNFQIGLQKGNRAIKDETQQTLFAKTGGVYDRDTENRQALSKQDIHCITQYYAQQGIFWKPGKTSNFRPIHSTI